MHRNQSTPLIKPTRPTTSKSTSTLSEILLIASHTLHYQTSHEIKCALKVASLSTIAQTHRYQ